MTADDAGLVRQLASQLFWGSTLLPGFALLVRLDRRHARAGLLSAAPLAFTLTLAAAAPLAVVAFAARWSVRTAAIAWAALVAASLIAAVLGGGGRWLRAAWRATARGPFLLTLLALAVFAPFGAVVGGDSPIHVAKVRWILDVGCTLQDAYSPAAVIESRYHVDVYHLLLAIGAWAGRRDPLEWWYESGWFARLLAIGGIELLATAILRSRRAAAIAALGGLFAVATTRTLIYPNKYTAYVVLPAAVAFTLAWLRRPRARESATIAAASLALAVVHVGFWVIVGLCLLPTAALLAWRRWRSGSLRPIVLLGACYLLPGIPFAAYTAMQPNRSEEQQGPLTASMVGHFDLGGLDLTFIQPNGPGITGLAGAAIVLLLLVRRGRREPDRFTALFWIVAAACMWFPPLFWLLTRVMPHWIVMRCGYALLPFAFAVAAGVPAWWLVRQLRRRHVRHATLVALLVVAPASALLCQRHLQRFRWTRDSHLEVEARAATLRELLALLPQPRPLLAADPETSTLLPAARHCSVVAPLLLHGNPADVGLFERAQRCEELFAPATAPERRAELLALLDVDAVVVAAITSRDPDGERAPEPIADASAFDACCERLAARDGFVLLRPRS